MSNVAKTDDNDDAKPPLQRSELVTRVRNSDGSVGVHVRDVTFEDLFQEQFVPLDSRKKVGEYVLGRTIGEGSFSKVRLGKHVKTEDKVIMQEVALHHNLTFSYCTSKFKVYDIVDAADDESHEADATESADRTCSGIPGPPIRSKEHSPKVAVKVIPKKTVLKRQDARRRFFRETRALRKLSHENIVRLHDVMETPDNYYLVMELVRGETFKDFLHRRSALSETDARPLFHQLATAVHYLHSQGIVHRDLKPDNFMLEGGVIKVVDFGLSAFAVSGASLTTQCGSPAFAAPEVFNKQPYDQSADIWSLGVILYRTLVGNLPFTAHGRSYVQLYAVILRGCDIPRALSAECRDLITSLLQVEPPARLASHAVTEHAWFHKART